MEAAGYVYALGEGRLVGEVARCEAGTLRITWRTRERVEHLRKRRPGAAHEVSSVGANRD